MDAITVMYAIMGVLVLAAALHWVYEKLMTRFSPKYVLKRKKKEDERYEHSRQKRRKRTEIREARLAKWAIEHPDDPDAKSLLAASSSLVDVASALADTAVGMADAEHQFVAELRRSQKATDEYRRRRAAEEAAAEVHAQELLDWAIENPATLEARRHLDEQLAEVTKRLEYLDSRAGNYRAMMKFKEEDSSETVLYSMQLAETEAKQAVEMDLVRRIRVALELPLPESSEQ